MRSSTQIEQSTHETDLLTLEVLLDIRELLQKMLKKPKVDRRKTVAKIIRRSEAVKK